jgi:hypothetical protein
MRLNSNEYQKGKCICRKGGEVFPSMNEDIDVLIERQETELSPLQLRMEELKNEFIKETVSFTSEWYKRISKEYVTKYPEVTLSMKEEQIAR